MAQHPTGDRDLFETSPRSLPSGLRLRLRPRKEVSALASDSSTNDPLSSTEKRASIRDVAALAGVSVGTVSNTINRPHTVRIHTRRAVEEAIVALNFVPNQHARVLTGFTSQIIGLVVLDIVSPFFMEIASAVERIANEDKHVVILCNSDNDPAREAQLLDMLADQKVRGILFTPASKGPRTDSAWLEKHRIPTVYVDYMMPETDCSVSVDNIGGAKMAVEHLLSLGRDRVAFVGDTELLHQFADRAQGTREALLAAGLDPATAFIEVKVPGIGIPDGILAAEQLLQGEMPTGILCGNDMMAFGVYRALSAAGVRIPEDVALIGYDDIDFAADWVLPLTSIRQPTRQLGSRAAQLLFEHTSGNPSHIHQQIVLQPELVIRNSTVAG